MTFLILGYVWVTIRARANGVSLKFFIQLFSTKLKGIMALRENRKKTILAEKISSLLNAAPTNIVSDEESEDTRAKVVERYEESDDSSDDVTKRSNIRKQNVQFLDELDKRYYVTTLYNLLFNILYIS